MAQLAGHDTLGKTMHAHRANIEEAAQSYCRNRLDYEVPNHSDGYAQ